MLSLDRNTLYLKRQRGALEVVCTPTLKSILGPRNKNVSVIVLVSRTAYLVDFLTTLYIV